MLTRNHLAQALVSMLFILSSTSAQRRATPILNIDLSDQRNRQVVVDKEAARYLGHPTTVLLDDQKTILIVYPMGHGAGQIVLKKSTDGGLSWSKRLPVPGNWSTSKEVPTIFKTVDSESVSRIIMFSGLYPARLAVSENNGQNWTDLRPVGEWGGIVVMSGIVRLKDGKYLAMFHDDGRFFRKEGKSKRGMTLYKAISSDGGLTWTFPEEVLSADTVHLCEPGIIRSPNGIQLAVLLRENSRTHNSCIIFSNDEGKTWTQPRELPQTLTGDRHTGKYAPDGRCVISFRDMAKDSPYYGDWVAWVGTYEDLCSMGQGQYRVRLMDNKVSTDCGYPGVEILKDGTFVLTSYGHWTENEMPYIVSVRLQLPELDSLVSSIRK